MKIIKLTLKYLLIVIVAIYLFGVGYYFFHTYPKTYYGSNNYGDLTKDSLIAKLDANETTDIELVEGDYKESIKGNDINYKNKFDSSSFDIKKNSLLWPIEITKKIDLKGKIKSTGTYDENLLKEHLLKTKLATTLTRTPSQDAQVALGESKYEVKPEVYGNELDKDKLVASVLDSVKNSNTTVDVKAASPYVKPKVFKDNPELKKQADYKNRWYGTNIILNLAGKKVPLIDNATDNGFKINTEEGYEENNTQKLTEFVDALAEKYNTVDKTRDFTTALGDKVEIQPGNFGFEVDKEALTALLNENLFQGNNTEIKVPFLNEGKNIDEDGFGDSYIEIDLSSQKIYAFENGQKIVDSNVVTGNTVISQNRATPPGAWNILWKSEKTNLVSNVPGDSYNAFVNYWMPFTQEQHGLHDAGWLEVYGGEIYKERGSHGCVNLMYNVAAKLYETFDAGTPVIIYESGRAPSPVINIYDEAEAEAPADSDTNGDS